MKEDKNMKTITFLNISKQSIKQTHHQIPTPTFSISTQQKIPLLSSQLHTHFLKFGFHNSNTFLFNKILTDLVHNHLPYHALSFLRLITLHNLKPDHFTFCSALSASAAVSSLNSGNQIYAYATTTGCSGYVHVATAAVDMYSKSGCLKSAEKVFAKMSCRNSRSWTVLMAAYARRKEGEEAMKVFRYMLREGIRSDIFSISTVASSSADIGGLEEGAQIHCIGMVSGFICSTIVSNSMITLYSKCGCLEEAEKVFVEMRVKDGVSWNALIFGYAQFGNSEKAVLLFQRRIQEGYRPDSFTFVGVLCACSRGGMVEKGMEYFEAMEKEHGVVPRMEHYTCGIDILSRAGRLEEAKEFIKGMPWRPDVFGWSSLLSSCRVYKNGEIGRWAAEEMAELRPENPVSYIMLSSIYVGEGRWEGVEEVRGKMRWKKEKGCSWIKYRGEVYVFGSEDGLRGWYWEEMERKLVEIERLMVEKGYVVHLESVIQNVEEVEKKRKLRYHSERLAIAFGLVVLPGGMPIRVMKNLRVCVDCHNVVKLMSAITGREILVRDCVRFHLFKNGGCSCGDFW